MRWKSSDLEKLKARVRKTYDFYIGIDCGTKTGLAVWSIRQKAFLSLQTTKIHWAMDTVRKIAEATAVFVVVEDARQVRFGTDPFKAQGAGSVKRDARIWEDFLTDLNIPFEMVKPNKRATKKSAEEFRQLTGYQGQTSSHGRDAALLVYSY